MARNKGTFKFGANFEVQAAEAFDPRVVVSTKAELINKETWPYTGDTIYVYNGLIVGVAEEKAIYMLIDRSKITDPSYVGWKRMDSEAAIKVTVIDNLESTSTTAALSANQGKVLGDRVKTLEGKITAIFTFKGTKATKTELPKDAQRGDVWHVTQDEGEYVYTGEKWELLGLSVDLTGYALKTEVETAKQQAITHADGIKTEINKALEGKVNVEPGKSLVETEKINQISTNSTNISSLQNTVNDLTSKIGSGESGLSKDVADLKKTVGNSNSGLVKDVADLKTGLEADNVRSIDTTAASGISLAQGSLAKSVKVNVNVGTLASSIEPSLSGTKIKIGKAINSGIIANETDDIATVINSLSEVVKTQAAGGITVITSTKKTIDVQGEGNNRTIDVKTSALVKDAGQSSLSAGEDNKLDLVWIEI